MRLLSQMHSSFRGVSGSLSVRSLSSFYLHAPPVPLFLSLSFAFPSSFAELPAFYFTRHTHKHHAHSRSHPHLLLSPPPLSPMSCSFFSTHQSTSCFFSLHIIIMVRPFSDPGTNSRVSGPPRDVGSPWFFIILVTGVVMAHRDTLFPNVIYCMKARR